MTAFVTLCFGPRSYIIFLFYVKKAPFLHSGAPGAAEETLTEIVGSLEREGPG